MSLSKSSIISQQNLTAPKSENNYTYEFEDFRLDSAHLMLYKDGETISLKPKTVETLVALVERRGEVVGKDELMNRLWADSFVEESNLTQNVYLLRKTLGKCADGRPFIENFSRRGYRFNGEIKTPTSAELVFATRTRTQTFIEEKTIENQTRRNWMITGAIAACGLLILASLVFLNFRNKTAVAAAAPFEAFKIKRHSETGDITGAKVSPDGKFIAYSTKKNAVWLKNTATDSNIKIIPESETIGSGITAISPDNNYIYIGRQVKDKKIEILKMSLFGGAAQQKVVEDSYSDLALSPDGGQLAFVRNNRETDGQELFVANTDGTGERKVTSGKKDEWLGMWSQSTAWSPGGNLIACTGGIVSEGKSIPNIKIFRALDGEEISLIKLDASWTWISDIAWLDGDTLLAIGGSQSSNGQIYKHTISTGEWRRVTNDLSDYVQLSVAAGGKTVITTQFDDPANLWILPADGDTNQAGQITFGRSSMTDGTGVSWTPDGKIVYATNTGGKWEIWTIDADGANQKQLTQNCAGNDSCGQPVASPDGRYIVFQATRNNAKNIWRMDADGANATQLTDEGGFYPSLSLDGRFIIYTRMISATGLWQVPIEGGKSEQFSKIYTASASSVSPDGKLFAFSYYDKTAKVPFKTCIAPVGTDAPEKCFGISRSFPRWTADGKAFYYLDHGYAGIWKQPLDGKRELFLEFPGERTNNFAFSPDGKRLVVVRSKPTQDIVALMEER
ncbi:MAG: winged helix-turn-helix domain-containing protein [Pyrinomonadaceae bacterium]